MKVLRFLLILILVIVVAFLVLGLIQPKEITVTRSATINAPKAVVWDQIVKYKNWNNWSPWYAMEPNKIKMTYFGNDGEAGSGYNWVGEKTGEGEMTNKGGSNGHMDFQLHFIKPMSGMADGSFDAIDTAGMTKVTWSMTNHMKYPWNALCIFFNPEKMIGGDFEKGLANMKKYCEANAFAMPVSDVKIDEVQFPGHTYAGIRSVVGWNDLQKFFSDSYMAVGKEAGARINGPATGLFYTWDTVKHQTDMMAVFPVSGTEPVKGATMVTIAPSKAYMAVHMGSYMGSMKEHMALGMHCASKNQKPTLVVEEYIKGPHEEKDSNKYVTNIYYLVP